MRKLVFLQGAQGVGKTTLLQDIQVAPKFRYMPFGEIARKLIKAGVGHGLNAPKDDYFAYIQRHLHNFNFYLKNCNDYDWFIGDRSIIDVLVYTRICHGRSHNYVAGVCEEVFEILREHIALIIYIPIDFDVVDDGIREASPILQMQYDTELKQVLQGLNHPFHCVKGSRSHRSDQINDLLSCLNSNQ